MKKIILLILLGLMSFQAWATPTKVIVRAKAKDAKFIGTSIGGALVIIRNKLTQEILAQGRTQGSTGNTKLIMSTPKERYSQISDDNTAKFLAEIDLDEPVFVTVEVLAPVNRKHSAVAASTELWLIPGKDILGDGIILEIPGFVVDILKPRTHQFINLSELSDNMLEVQANIVMMCGCTISEGGLWDAAKIEVKGILSKNGKKVADFDLKAGSPNLFSGKIAIDEAGTYELLIYAYHSVSGNTGVDKINYIIGN